MHGGWGLGMGFLWIPLLAILAVVLVVALRGLGGDRDPPARPPSPLEILQRRYASGEISREDYERARRDLA